MLDKVFFTLLLAIRAGASPNKFFIPTSVTLDVAEEVAKGEGYSLADRTKFFFDVMLDEDNKPAFPGFITVGFYWNSDIVSAISINEETGQVLDIDKCTVFDYPQVHTFQQNLSRGTGAPALPLEALSKKVGCDSLRRLSVPRKAP